MVAPYDNLLTAIFNQVSGSIGVLRTASIKKHDDAWTWFTMNLDTLKDVVTAHVTAINVVVEPIVAASDLETTVTYYRALVNNPQFPQVYGEIRGALEGMYTTAIYTDDMRQAIGDLAGAMYGFQRAAFLLHGPISSWELSDAFEDASRLYTLLERRGVDAQIDELQKKVADDLSKAYAFFASQRDLHGDNALAVPGWPGAPTTAVEELLERVRLCSRLWQRTAQFELYGGRGVNYFIALLKAMRYK
jgi:hypothetical protein